MQRKKRIYCVEGVHDWGNDQIEPTVEPMLLAGPTTVGRQPIMTSFFMVMNELELKKALTTDRHFRQARFESSPTTDHAMTKRQRHGTKGRS